MKYLVKVPPTATQGSYTTTAKASYGQTMKQAALQDYNTARSHDGLEPLNRMPAGTTYSPVYEWEIHCFTSEGWECVNTETARLDAIRSIREYRENQPGNYKLKKVPAE